MQTGSHKHNRASQTLVMFNVCWLEKVLTIVSIGFPVIHPCGLYTILLFNSFILAAVLKTLAVPTPQFLLGFWHLLIGLNCPRVRPHGKKNHLFSFTLCYAVASWHFPFPIGMNRTFLKTSKDWVSNFASCLWSDMELVSEEKEGMKRVVPDNKEIGRPTKSWGQRLLKFRPEPRTQLSRLQIAVWFSELFNHERLWN